MNIGGIKTVINLLYPCLLPPIVGVWPPLHPLTPRHYFLTSWLHAALQNQMAFLLRAFVAICSVEKNLILNNFSLQLQRKYAQTIINRTKQFLHENNIQYVSGCFNQMSSSLFTGAMASLNPMNCCLKAIRNTQW